MDFDIVKRVVVVGYCVKRSGIQKENCWKITKNTCKKSKKGY